MRSKLAAHAAKERREATGPVDYEARSLCFECKTRPAGTPGHYKWSAYCTQDQLALFDRVNPTPTKAELALRDELLAAIAREGE